MGYMALRTLFYDQAGRSQKGERLDIFKIQLKRIRSYIQRGDEDDWKRSLVCGIFFINGALAINIQQLRFLLGKCKSSINGSFQRLGYIAELQTQDVETTLSAQVPACYRSLCEFKKWTIRCNKEIMLEAPRKGKFVIEIPSNMRAGESRDGKESGYQPRSAEEIQKMVEAKYPCPAKWRHKYIDVVRQCLPMPTEA